MAAALTAEQAGETVPGLHPGRFSDSAERDSALRYRASSRAWWAATWPWRASRAKARCLRCACRAVQPH